MSSEYTIVVGLIVVAAAFKVIPAIRALADYLKAISK
jgi:hypothetical protein